MDISVMMYAKNNDKPYSEEELRKFCYVHRLPARLPEIYHSCGLAIVGFGRNNGTGSKPDAVLSLPKTPPSDSNFIDDKKAMCYFEFYNISHMFDGHGFYWTPMGGRQEVKRGDCIIVSPYRVQSYGGWKSFYQEDAVAFCGPAADALFKNKIVRDGIFKMGRVRRLLPIIEAAIDPLFSSQLQAGLLLQNLLLEIHRENKGTAENTHAGEISALLQLIKTRTSKYWTVSEMAEFCNLGESQFRRIFIETTGISPKHYIDRIKIQKAASILRSSEFRISDIALKLGYTDPFHFSRRFKEIIGSSPDEYRRNAIK